MVKQICTNLFGLNDFLIFKLKVNDFKHPILNFNFRVAKMEKKDELLP